MSDQNPKNVYDDEDIPKVDLSQGDNKTANKKDYDNIEPLPESTRPRKDGPGGE